MFRSGGVILTFMPTKFWKRGLFQHSLYLYHRFLIWLKYRKKKLHKVQKQIAARCTHVQLDIGRGPKQDSHLFLNVTYPKAKLEVYNEVRLQNEPWQAYARPLFFVNHDREAKMYEFSRDLVNSKHKKLYDWLQLFSYILNILIWTIKPSSWGKEVNHMLNRPGGREVCSSGAAACLRYTEVKNISQTIDTGTFELKKIAGKVKLISSKESTDFFKGYDTAMVSPVLFILEGKWELPGELYEVNAVL